MTTFDDLTTAKRLPSIADNPLIYMPIFDDGFLVGRESVWVVPHTDGLVKLDDIPVQSTVAHQYDLVSYRYNHDGEALFTGVVETSGYKTLHIALNINPFNPPLNPQDELVGHKIFSDLNRLDLDYVSFDGVCVVAIPPSLNMIRIALFKARHPGLLYELL